MDPATRLVTLLGLFGDRPVWSGTELSGRLGVTPRTIRRDISRLRDLDYPVEAVSGPHGGYRMGRGPSVPPLQLDDVEALAVVIGLRMATHTAAGMENAAASALAKLERVLPERLFEQLRSVHDATRTEPFDATTVAETDQLLVLAQATMRCQRVRFFYVAADGAKSLRHVDPSRLVYEASRWYLVAFDLDRDDWRTFRVDRLRSAITTGAACAVRQAPDALELVRSGRTVNAYPVRALVRLHIPFERAPELVPPYAGVVEPEEANSVLWRVGGSTAAAVASWIASMPCHVEVVEPPEVRDALAEHLRVLTGTLADPVVSHVG